MASANGSTFMEINKKSFRAIECVLPKSSDVRDFTKVVTPLFGKVFNNSKEIRALAEIRDILLPKLMRGEVRVQE